MNTPTDFLRTFGNAGFPIALQAADELDRLRAENARLLQEREAMARDAERYRYLRNRLPKDVLERTGTAAGCWIDCEEPSGPGEAELTLLTGDDADAAIDAAMKDQP